MIGSPVAPQYQAEPAGFFIRTLAYIVDAFLLSLVGGAFPYLFISASQPNTAATAASPPAGSASLLLSLVYFVFFWSRLGGGQTMGMRLCHLKVVGGDGGLIGVGNAVVRWIGLWVSFLLCFIGVLWVGGDSRKQGWHDHMANTYVIHV